MSDGNKKPTDSNYSVIADQLRSFIDRFERLEKEKEDIMNDMREVMVEAKGNGYDTKIIKKIIKVRKQDATERAEQAAVFALYCNALDIQGSEYI